jgi:uncharacterized tellurite resistance protein B-like protein
MDFVTRRKVCELVAGIIATDQELHPSELTFMLKTFETFGIGSSDDDEAMTPLVSRAEAAKTMAELPDDIRKQTLDLLIESAAIDGKVVPAEREFLRSVAKAAGLPDESIDESLAARLLSMETS